MTQFPADSIEGSVATAVVYALKQHEAEKAKKSWIIRLIKTAVSIIVLGFILATFAASGAKSEPPKPVATATVKHKSHIAHKRHHKKSCVCNCIKNKVVDTPENLANVVAGIEERVTTLEEKVEANDTAKL